MRRPSEVGIEFWDLVDSWRPPFVVALRSLSVLPLLSAPSIVVLSQVPVSRRLLLAAGTVVAAYFVLSCVMYLALRGSSKPMRSVAVERDHLGWLGDVVVQLDEYLGGQQWRYSTVTGGPGGGLVPGGAAITEFSADDLTAVLVVLSVEEKPTSAIDVRFVSVTSEGWLVSTGNAPPGLPARGMHQYHDQKATARELWELHCQRNAGSTVDATLDELTALLGPPGEHPNPVRQAGFWRFIRIWAFNAWRPRGLTKGFR